jgi:DHA2 family multidrug resistance protein
VALLTVLIDRRETLHSARLFQHLQAAGANTAPWLERAANIATVRGGVSPHDVVPTATALLREVGTRQSETLANADAFLFMAVVGVIALCLVPLIPPTPPAK